MRSLGKLRPRQEDITKMDPKEIEWESMDWIDLPEDKNKWCHFVNMVINRFHNFFYFIFFLN
jgi:hypothetical protein